MEDEVLMPVGEESTADVENDVPVVGAADGCDAAPSGQEQLSESEPGEVNEPVKGETDEGADD